MRHLFQYGVIFLLSSLSLPILAGGIEELKSYGIHFKMVAAGATTFPILEMGRLEEMPSVDNHTAGQVLTYDRPILEVLRDIQRKYGAVEADCGTFVQIAAQLLRDREEVTQARNFILFPRGTFSVDFASRVFGMKFAYIEPSQADVVEIMQRTSFISKGHWVLELAQNQFIGLIGSGPLVTNARDWMKITRADLYKEIQSRSEAERVGGHSLKCVSVLEALTPSGRALIETRLAQAMRKTGDFNLWTIRLPKF